MGKQGQAAGRSRVLAVDQSEANRGHAMRCRLAGSATAVKFQKVPSAIRVLPYWQPQLEWCLGFADLCPVVILPANCCNPRGLRRVWEKRPSRLSRLARLARQGSHGPLSSNGPLRGFFCSGPSGAFGGLWDHGRAISRHCGTLVRDIERARCWLLLKDSAAVMTMCPVLEPGLVWVGQA